MDSVKSRENCQVESVPSQIRIERIIVCPVKQEISDTEYCGLYQRYLELVQKYEEKSAPVHLVFAPLGSNVLFLARHVFHNVSRGVKTTITRGEYAWDRKAIEEFNNTYGTDHTLDPWVLQRYDDHFDHPCPWEIWFHSLNENDSTSQNFREEKKRLARLIRRHGRSARRETLARGLCLAYVTRFNDSTHQLLGKHDCIGGRKAVAVHIRRGDAATEDLTAADPNRDHHYLDEYIRQINSFCLKGYKDFYILTESQKEIDSLCQQLGHRCRILSSELDRGKFQRIQKSEFDPRFFVEYECLTNPKFAKFSMESALIDMFNARQCQAFIGTFSSQFSVLNYLNIVGRVRRDVEITDLSNVPYEQFFGPPSTFVLRVTKQAYRLARFANKSRKRLQRSLQRARCRLESEKHLDKQFKQLATETQEKALLVIKERDVGFFSLFLQVVNTLLCVDGEDLDCSVYVDFGDKQSYYSGSNTWLDFFSQIPGWDAATISDKVDRVNHDFEKRIHDQLLWEAAGSIYKVDPDLFWTGSYYPLFSPDSSQFHIDFKGVPSQAERDKAARVIQKYVSVLPEIQDELAHFIRDNHLDRFVIGVQFRGTDARQDSRRTIPTYDLFFETVREQLEQRDHEAAVVVASDEQSFVDAIRGHFQNAVCYNTIRHQAGDRLTGRGPQGLGMPAFIGKDQKSALAGAVLDYLILCQSNVLIHNVGSLSNAVLLTNPATQSVVIGADLK